jgi:predicted nucleotide-binding protein
MRVGIIGSQLSGLTTRSTLGYETQQIQKACTTRGHRVQLIDPKRTTCGVEGANSFARFRTLEDESIDVTDLDAILVRRTGEMIDEILDFLKFSIKANQDLLVVDTIESMGRPTSKVESISKRAGVISQPDTQILSIGSDLSEGFDFPLISKPMFGTGGNGVVLCQDAGELDVEVNANYSHYSGYATIVQKDVTGKDEYRIVVVNGVAVGCVSKPAPQHGIARNASFVSEFSDYTGINKSKIMAFAEKVSLYMGQFFSGVDIVERDGKLYVLECNRNPQFQHFDFATNARVADVLVEAIENARHSHQVKKPQKPQSVDSSSVRKPRVFIGSSSEGLKIAEVVQWSLESKNDVETTIWKQGVFKPSATGFQSLDAALQDFDFAIFVLTADDKTSYRELDVVTARDNVIFEAGLFMGALGTNKVFLLASSEAMPKVPTDLNGVNLVTWAPHSNGNLRSALGGAMYEIREEMGL